MTPLEQELQRILDQAAYFNLVTVADPRRPCRPRYEAGSRDRLTGVDVAGLGRRFDVDTTVTPRGELRTRNAAGEIALSFRFRWAPIPDDYVVTPGCVPPPTPLDTSRSQRFALLDGEFLFDTREKDGFCSLGSGRTFPLEPARPGIVHLAAIGNVLGGTGQLAGLYGVYVLSGVFRPPADFRLNILLQIQDPSGNLLAKGPLAPLRPEPDPVPGSTFLLVHTNADPNAMQPIAVPSDLPPGQAFEAKETTRLVRVDFATGGEGLRSRWETGARVGSHQVRLWTFPSESNPGTPLAPIPFFDREEFLFVDKRGKTTGTLKADVVEGRTLVIPMPGLSQQETPQLASGFARLRDGTGQFAGCRGLVTNVAIGTIDPHLTSIVYLFEVFDAGGGFRAR